MFSLVYHLKYNCFWEYRRDTTILDTYILLVQFYTCRVEYNELGIVFTIRILGIFRWPSPQVVHYIEK